MKFQIKQNYGKNCGGYIYFDYDISHDEDYEQLIIKLKKISKDEMLKEWKSINPALYFTAPKPAAPTINVVEYKDGKKVKNGIIFKTKWR